MHAHPHVPLPADRHDGFEEVAEILAELVAGDALVRLHQGAESGHGRAFAVAERAVDEALRLDDEGVDQLLLLRVGDRAVQRLDLLQHVLREILLRAFALEDLDVEIGEADPVEIQRRGPVGHGVLQVGARPVDHGHEVVADRMDAAAAQVLQALLVGLDQRVAAGTGVLDLLAHGQALDDRPAQAGRGDVVLQGADVRFGPQFARGVLVQGGHDPFHADLAQHAQSYLVGRAEPSPGFLHFLGCLVGGKVRKFTYI